MTLLVYGGGAYSSFPWISAERKRSVTGISQNLEVAKALLISTTSGVCQITSLSSFGHSHVELHCIVRYLLSLDANKGMTFECLLKSYWMCVNTILKNMSKKGHRLWTVHGTISLKHFSRKARFSLVDMTFLLSSLGLSEQTDLGFGLSHCDSRSVNSQWLENARKIRSR